MRRNAQRIVHIPFFEPAILVSEAEQLRSEDSMGEARKRASGAIGQVILLQKPLVAPQTRAYVGEHLLPFVATLLPNVHYRVKKCYALVLVAARLVS